MQAAMMWPFADFMEGILAFVHWLTKFWHSQSAKPNPEPEMYGPGPAPTEAPASGVRQSDCYGIAKRLGCYYPGFYGYDREHDEQWVSFTPNLGEDLHTAGTAADIKIHVCYYCTSADNIERQVRRALERQIHHEISLRQRFLEKWPDMVRTTMRTNGCTEQNCRDIADELGCRLDFSPYARDAWRLEFTPELGEKMATAGRTVGAMVNAFHALTPAALERKVRNALRKQAAHEIELRQGLLAKLQEE